MYRVIFKDLRRSDLAENVVTEKLQHIFDKFPELQKHNISFSMAMLNSPLHAGPDLFSAKLQIAGKRFNNIIIEKKASNLYKAIAQVFAHVLELLAKKRDKIQTKRKHLARKQLRQLRESY